MGNINDNYPDKRYFLNFGVNKRKIISFSMISGIFNKNCQNGFINKQGFNECIKFLFCDDVFPLLAYSFLSEKLFNLLDYQRVGTLNFETFSKGVCNVLSCQETRTKILFQAMMQNPNKNYLMFDDLFQFFYNSWIYGFNYIFNYINYYYKQEFMQKNIPIPSNQGELHNLVNKHKEDLNNYLVKSLYDSGININSAINYENFKHWALKDNTVEIIYSGKIFRFATGLKYFENIGLNITG
jgi:hypothetical protein